MLHSQAGGGITPDADGLIGDPDFNIDVDKPVNLNTRENLDRFIADYNAMYQTA